MTRTEIVEGAAEAVYRARAARYGQPGKNYSWSGFSERNKSVTRGDVEVVLAFLEMKGLCPAF